MGTFLKRRFVDNSTQGQTLYKPNIVLKMFTNIVKNNFINIYTVVKSLEV